MSDFSVEFEIANEDRFRQLTAVFDALRAAKISDEWRDDDFWLEFFDEKSRSHFWWPTQAEKDDWLRRWLATPVAKRFNDPSLVMPWGFGSMIEAFRNGEYELVECCRVSDRVGSLRFDPFSHPYGGSDCMRALVESFGHRIIAMPEV